MSIVRGPYKQHQKDTRQVLALAALLLFCIERPAAAALVNLGPGSFTALAPVIRFDEVALGTVNPSFPFTNLSSLGDVTVSFGGHFVGQASGGSPVTLVDNTPTGPLTLDAAAPQTSTTNDFDSDSSPVLSGTPLFNGPMSVWFSKPVAGVGLKGGYFNTVGATAIEAYGADGTVLGRITNSVLQFEFYGLADSTGANVIKGISFFITGSEPAGFEIDNLTFGAAGDVVLPSTTPGPHATVTPAPGCQTFYSTDVPKAIPDLGSATSTLSVPAGMSIGSVHVIALQGTHTFVQDLEFHLISPANTDVTIINHGHCGRDQNFNLSLDDTAGATEICPPNDGMAHRPSNPLSAFSGQSPGGTWTLRVNDVDPEDGGQLQSWGLEICQPVTPPPPGCVTRFSTDVPKSIPDLGMVVSTVDIPPGMPITDVNVLSLQGTHTFVQDLEFHLISPDGIDVTIINHGQCGLDQNFNLGLDDASLLDICPLNDGLVRAPNNPLAAFNGQLPGGTWTLKVIDVDALDSGTLTMWGLQVCGPMPTPAPGCTTYTSSDVPKDVPDLGMATSTISVPPGMPISDVNMPSLQGTHTFVQDLEFHLLSPQGTDVTIINYGQCGRDHNFNLGLDDDSLLEICPLTDGSVHHPNNPLATFNGENPGGTWTLKVIDVDAEDSGQLTHWQLEICGATGGTPTPTPTVGPCDPGDVLAAVGSGKVKRFRPNGTLVQTLDTTTNAEFTTGMAFDDIGNLFVTNFFDNSLSKFDPVGTVVAPRFVSGLNASPESIVFDKMGNLYVGQADGAADILKFDASGNLLAGFDVAREDRGSDWVELSSDQCTIFYTSEGTTIKRFNACTNAQMPDFASGLPRPCFALRLLPSGEVLVACAPAIQRLSAGGNVIQTYDAPGQDNWFALNLDPNSASFWSGDLTTGQIYQFNLATGAVLQTFSSAPFTSLAGLAVCKEPISGGPTPTVTTTFFGATRTPTPTRTRTLTPTRTETSPPTHTPTGTFTPTRSHTPTHSHTPTVTPTGTRLPTDTPTHTLTPTRTQTSTVTRKPKLTFTPTRTEEPTTTPTPSHTASVTETAAATVTGTREPVTPPPATATPSPTPTTTPTATGSRTGTATATATGSVAATFTTTRKPKLTFTPTPSVTVSPTGTVTATGSPATPAATLTGSQTPGTPPPTSSTTPASPAPTASVTAATQTPTGSPGTPTGTATGSPRTPTASTTASPATPTATGSLPPASPTATGSVSPGTPTRTGSMAPATQTPTASPATPTVTGSRTVGTPPATGSASPAAATPTGLASPGIPTPTGKVTALATLTPSPTPTPRRACVGDCNGDGQVTIDSLIIMVNIALDNDDVSRCLAGDPNGNGITIDEIITAVNNALSGCPVVVPTFTPTPEGTPGPDGTVARYAAGTTVGLSQGLRAIPAVFASITQLARGGSLAAFEAGGAAAVQACSVGGTRDFVCTQTLPTTSPRDYTLSFTDCELGAAGGGSVTLDGTVTGQSTEGGALAVCSFPPTSLSSVSLNNVRVLVKNAAGAATLNAQFSLTGSLAVIPAVFESCRVSGFTMVLSGTANVQSSSLTETLTFDGTSIRLDVEQFSQSCVPVIYRMTLNGAATFSIDALGIPLSGNFNNFVFHDDTTAGSDVVTVAGQLDSTCVGTPLQFSTPTQISLMAAMVCPAAGALLVTASATTDRVIYNSAGGVDLDRGNDSSIDETFASCLDTNLYVCPGG